MEPLTPSSHDPILKSPPASYVGKASSKLFEQLDSEHLGSVE